MSHDLDFKTLFKTFLCSIPAVLTDDGEVERAAFLHLQLVASCAVDLTRQVWGLNTTDGECAESGFLSLKSTINEQKTTLYKR